MIRGAIVGTGHIVDDIHMPALRALPQVEVIALCEINPERAGWFRARHNIASVYETLEDLIDKQPGIDFVDIATPPHTHFALVQLALEAGLHVMVEKPLALNAAQARDLAQLADKHNRKLTVLHSYRCRDMVIRAHNALRANALGELRQIAVAAHGGEIFSERSSWTWNDINRQLLIYELGIHYIDLALFFAGPMREIAGFRAIVEPGSNAVKQIHALIEHESGVITTLDLQVESGSQFTHFSLFGSKADIFLRFFPESFRMASGQHHPFHDLRSTTSQVWSIGSREAIERVIKPQVHRRVKPHFRVMEAFVRSLENPELDPPIPATSVVLTLELADALVARIQS